MKSAPADKIIPEDYSYQGRILARAGRADEGIAVLNKAIGMSTDAENTKNLQRDLATAYTTKKDYANAARIYAQLAKSGDLTDQFRLATVYSVGKQYTRADSVYNIINTAKPTYAPAYLSRAKANAGLDPEAKQGLAKPHYDKYIELSKAEGADPTKFREGLVEAYGYLGVYNFQKGDKAAALANFQQVLALDPENKGAASNISILQAKPRTTTTAKKTTTTTVKKK